MKKKASNRRKCNEDGVVSEVDGQSSGCDLKGTGGRAGEEKEEGNVDEPVDFEIRNHWNFSDAIEHLLCCQAGESASEKIVEKDPEHDEYRVEEGLEPAENWKVADVLA